MAARSSRSEHEQDARTRFRVLLATGGLVLGLSTLLLPHPAPFRPGVLVGAVLLSALILGGLQVLRFAGFWEAWGDAVAVGTVALVVAGTGGTQSVYADLYLLPLLSAAALHPLRRLVAVAALTAVGLLAPLVYETTAIAGPYVTDLVVDGAIWLLAAAVVHRQAEHRQRQEADARANEARFRRLAEHAQDGIYRLVLVPETRFEYVNPAMEAVTGYPPEDFYADPDLPLRRVHPEDRELVRRSRNDPQALPDTVEVRWRHPEGRWLWHALREAPVTEDGQLVAIQGIVRDVTAQKIREEELQHDLAREQEAAEDLRQLDVARTTTIRAVAHDLRSPLMTINGFVEMLRGRHHDMAAEEVDHMLDRISNSGRRLERILNDLLELEQVGAQRGISRSPIDLGSLVRSVVKDLDAPDHPIEIHSPEGTDAVAEVDAARLERAIENLLVNAIRHTPPATPVTVRIAREPDGHYLEVEDEGPGVPQELRSTIFEPFERGGASGEGTGVGLSLVRAIAELHDGRCWVEDGDRGGARFVLFLPIRG